MTIEKRLKRLIWKGIQALRLERVYIVFRAAQAVREPTKMVLTELFGTTNRLLRFTLRKSGQTVFLRSRTSDIRVFYEILCFRGYELDARALQALSDRPLVIDAGANIGLFSLFVTGSCPGVSVIAFEPDEDNAAVARRNLAELLQTGQVQLVQAAVGTSVGEIAFVAGRGMVSRRAQADDAATTSVPQVDLFDHLEGAGLVKLDIEGGEWDILGDERWPRHMPPSLVMEWHGWHESQTGLDPVEELQRLLSPAEEIEHADPVPGNVGTLWAFRPPVGSTSSA